MAKLHGLVRIHVRDALVETFTLSTKEIGEHWLAYLNGEESVFGAVCQFSPRSTGKRLHWAEWKEIRKRIFARDGYACTYCGATERLECDHIVPVARGGGHSDENLTTACRSCNASKGSKLIETVQ